MVDVTADLRRAIVRRETKGELAQVLHDRALNAVDRQSVLLDLLAEGMGQAAPSTRGRPRKKKGGSRTLGRTDKVFKALLEQHGMPIKELSVRTYGEDSKDAQNKTRALLTALKRQGRVNNPQTGYWEVPEK